MYYVYILKSLKDQNKYIGFTTDLKKRLKEHNCGGTKYSSTKSPFEIIWYCTFPNKKRATDFERYLKSSSGFAFSNKRLIT